VTASINLPTGLLGTLTLTPLLFWLRGGICHSP
jgi:hypothetical protein